MGAPVRPSVAGGLRQGRLQGLQLGGLPGLEGDVAGLRVSVTVVTGIRPLGRLHLGLHVGGGVLAVVDVDLDLVGRDLGVDRGLVGRRGFRALADRPQESGRREHLSPSAGASSVKMLSEAPTGVPAYSALMVAMSSS